MIMAARSYSNNIQLTLLGAHICAHQSQEKSNLSFSRTFGKLKLLMQSSRSLLTVTVVDNKCQVELRGSLCYHYHIDALLCHSPKYFGCYSLDSSHARSYYCDDCNVVIDIYLLYNFSK